MVASDINLNVSIRFNIDTRRFMRGPITPSFPCGYVISQFARERSLARIYEMRRESRKKNIKGGRLIRVSDTY